MDMTFLRRAERILEEREPMRARSCAAGRGACGAADGERRRASPGRPRPLRMPGAEDDALIELLLAGPRWREAAIEAARLFQPCRSGTANQ